MEALPRLTSRVRSPSPAPANHDDKAAPRAAFAVSGGALRAETETEAESEAKSALDHHHRAWPVAHLGRTARRHRGDHEAVRPTGRRGVEWLFAKGVQH